MARTVVEAPITTPNARAKLKPGVHWRGVDTDIHLGYRKAARGGRWLVRWYNGDGKYRQEGLAAADDTAEADGVDVLTFKQAQGTALRVVEEKRKEAIAAAEGPAPTVRSAVEAYLDVRAKREAEQKGEHGRRKNDAKLRLTKHVLHADIADVPLHKLTEDDLANWQAHVGKAVAKDTVRRLANDFKAALNAAAMRHRKKLPPELPLTIKTGLAVGEPSPPTPRDAQALSDNEIRALLDAAREVDAEGNWDGDLFRLVLTLAATGARFSQVARMKVADVQASQGRLMIPVSRKGKGTKKASHIAVRVGADVLAELRFAVAGRRGTEPLFERWRHVQKAAENGNPPMWVRSTRAAWGVSDELTRPWRLIANKAGLPADVVPYSLRHSSIVRQLRTNLPARLVAALHDTSTAMIESHYSAAIVDAMDELSAGAIIPLVTNETRVVRLVKEVA